MDLPNAGSIWFTAADTSYVHASHWKAWADAQIAQKEMPERWLIDMALARDVSALGDALLHDRKHDVYFDDRLALGFACLKYERGDYASLVEFLQSLFDAADNAGDAGVDPELFSELLSALSSESIGEDSVLQSLHEIIGTHKERALRAWESLGTKSQPQLTTGN
jgi:hypothetical protein